jgi:hypothetical protein
MTAYTQYGPLVDGSAPGLDSSFFNGIEGFLLTINPLAVNTALTPSVFTSSTPGLTGITAGSVTMWQLGGPNTGSTANCFKMYLFYFSGYENTTGVRLRITLPSPFATGGMAWVGGIHNPSSGKGIYIVNNTSGGVNFDIVNGYNSSTSQLQLPCFSRGEWGGEVSYMDVDGSTTPGSGASGWVLLLGI